MKILVTGGAGFIGSHVTDAFIAAGHQVTVLDDLSSGSRNNLNERAEFVQGSINDGALVADLFHSHHFDVVDHHAAEIDVRKSVEDPIADANVNILGSLHLLEASRKTGVKQFIFASTGGAIYGEQEYFPADEHHPTNPESPYGVTKRSVELYLEAYRRMYGLQYTAFRYSNVYGPRQDPKGEAGVVAIFCNNLLSGKGSIIFGDGKQTRDYLFVGDLVRAHLLALVKSESSGIYNLATGKETNVNELYRTLADIFERRDLEVTYAPKRTGEQQRSVCDVSKVTKELGWSPSVDIMTGLTETAVHFRNTVIG